MNTKQFLLVVDNHDTFLEYKEKEICHTGKGFHHRAFVVFLYDKKNQVLLQKRKHKRWNNVWDVTATSHVLHFPNHDETYGEAALRSLKEEMGVTGVSLKNIGAFNYFRTYGKQCENEYCAILVGEYEGNVISNTDFIYEYKWMDASKLLKEIQISENKYSPWLVLSSKNSNFKNLFQKKNISIHIAFIMDGNRRWAREKGLKITVGHTKGYRNIEPIVNYAVKKNISYLTFWAFSTENWNRSKEEVEFLMNIFRKFFKSSLMDRLKRKGVKIITIGDLTRFPFDIQKEIQVVIEETKNNNGIAVAIGLNYGGREEILKAVEETLKKNPQKVTQEEFSANLFTKDIPDPDLIIRTGKEKRLSGFLPWQSVYSELYFTDTYWPDFDEKEFQKALDDYSNRQRRFGE